MNGSLNAEFILTALMQVWAAQNATELHNIKIEKENDHEYRNQTDAPCGGAETEAESGRSA